MAPEIIGDLDKAGRDAIVIKFMPFARSIAGQMSAQLSIDFDDAAQSAYIGLIEAAQRFDMTKYDPERGSFDNNFKSFAYLRMRGAIIDQVRRDNFVRRRGHEQGLAVPLVSLDAMSNVAEHGGLTALVEVADVERNNEHILDFEAALTVLSPREYRVVMGCAVGGKGREFAEEFGVTESRVSQIAAEARAKLEQEMV